MDFRIRLKIKNSVVEKSNEGVKFSSYDRFIQKKRKETYVRPIGNKTNICLCKKDGTNYI